MAFGVEVVNRPVSIDLATNLEVYHCIVAIAMEPEHYSWRSPSDFVFIHSIDIGPEPLFFKRLPYGTIASPLKRALLSVTLEHYRAGYKHGLILAESI